MTYDELKTLQSLSLDIKILKTKQRIKDAIDYFGYDGLYVSFSGGKDSTVLHHLVLEVEFELWGEKRIPRVFCDTGLEYPELRKFALTIADEVIKPEMTFKDVLTKYGYPVISKDQSYYIYQAKHTKSDKLRNLRLKGSEKGNFKISDKWMYLLDGDIPIHSKCCDIMKKKPFKQYDKSTGRVPIVGVMANESRNRTIRYVQDGGCNAFNTNHPQSRPLGFWTEQDVLQYILKYNVEIASVYGDIVSDVEGGQMSLLTDGTLKTTGCNRTGCVFCMYGCHLETGKNRFEMLKESHPKLYDYCIRGGKHDEQGRWIPDNGLGMGHVLDTLNIKY